MNEGNLWQCIYKKLCEIQAGQGGTITVEPSAAWEALFQSAVEAALENVTVDVNINNTPVEVVINTDDGPVEITGSVTIDTSGGPIEVIVTDLPDVVLDPSTINDLAVAIAGQTLTVTLTAEDIAALEAAFSNAIRFNSPVPCSGFCWTSGETSGEFVGYATQSSDGTHGFTVISGEEPPAGAAIECRTDKLLDAFINMEKPVDETDPCIVGEGKTSFGRLKFDVNPASISKETWGAGVFEMSISGCKEPVVVSLSDFPLVIGTAPNGDPFPTSIIDAINSIGGNIAASALGLDAEGTNSILCLCGPTGADWKATIKFTNSDKSWQLNWNDAAGEFTVDDDDGALGLTGSAANCEGKAERETSDAVDAKTAALGEAIKEAQSV